MLGRGGCHETGKSWESNPRKCRYAARSCNQYARTKAQGSRIAYACLIVDAFSRMIVGWRVVAHMRTGVDLDALEMAR